MVPRRANDCRFPLLGLWTFIVGALLGSPAAIAEDRSLTEAIAPLYHSQFRYVGSPSCAAAACHQGPRPGVAVRTAARGNEYGLWAVHDPHAAARETLGSDVSSAMLARLNIIRNGRLVDAAGYDNCLRCHALHPSDAQRSQPWTVNEGVSCEACHGPAEKWLTTHVAANWKREHNFDSGMLATQNLLVRARLCADCHVGSINREVNHDMIAAGHPPLRFEMAADHARLPKHWRDPQEQEPDFEWALWIAGQIASAEANLHLSHARVTGKAVYQVWPEFAEYNCGDCHHALDVPTVRERPSHAAQDSPAWGDWHFTFLACISDAQVESTSLRRQMTKGFIKPDRELAGNIESARRSLHQWIQAQDPQLFDAVTLQRIAGRIEPVLRQQAEGGAASWEEAAQIYLALRARDAAAYRQVDSEHPQLQSLQRMREALRFDQARQSRLFFSAPPGQRTIPYDVFQRELKDYVLSAAE